MPKCVASKRPIDYNEMNRRNYVIQHRWNLMSQTLTLPGDIYSKLAQGAAERGMTIESLLAFVSDLVVVPDRPTEQDQQRVDRMDRLLDRYRTGKLSAEDGAELNQLIAADYQAANVRADRLRKTQITTSRFGRHLYGMCSCSK